MLKYRVGKSETCHYKTIQEAINAVPYNTSAEIFIEAGIYKEKIFCEKSDLTIIGENCKNTIITFSDGAKFKDADGDNINTFRSYTAFFGGENIRVENLSIFNEAGESKTAGQSLAVYADAKNVTFKNVYMKSCQDTLFLAPMPEKERITGGFKGPREYVPRFLTKQTYISCKIEGDIDFIFGGADTVFYECDIVSVGESGYVTAPSGKEDGLGLVFYKCRFLSNSEKHSHYLGRPWRKFGKTTLIDCFVGEHIKPEGWDFWNEEENKNTCFFAEYNCNYPKNYTKNRVSWAKELTDSELNYIMSEIEK
ncbi:MAG: pectinesterase family protein, partial [Defluviitaleaceae bacterium]|nr:pectinesterase family protein [Defluviitaleaceae bacterium]